MSIVQAYKCEKCRALHETGSMRVDLVINILATGGWTTLRIAQALDISETTVRRVKKEMLA